MTCFRIVVLDAFPVLVLVGIGLSSTLALEGADDARGFFGHRPSDVRAPYLHGFFFAELLGFFGHRPSESRGPYLQGRDDAAETFLEDDAALFALAEEVALNFAPPGIVVAR